MDYNVVTTPEHTMNATTYTANHNGTEYTHTSKAKKAPSHFVILTFLDGSSEPCFMAYRSSEKSAHSEAARIAARFTSTPVAVDVVACH